MSITNFLNLTDSFQFVVNLCVIGIIVCLYAIKIEKDEDEYKKDDDKQRVPRMCDINDSMSCTAVLTSKYSHMTKLIFGLSENSVFNYSNAHYGLVFYIGLLLFQFYPFTLIPYHEYIFLCMSIASIIASCGLAWILYYILHNFCMICVCMYIVNAFLLTSSIMHVINMS